MDFRTFGRTGLSVSLAGIGCGGASKLGLNTGSTENEAIALIRKGLELGINYFDTADLYGTEDLLGRALEGHRDEAVISSKVGPRGRDGALLDKSGVRRALDAALRNLRIDVIEVYHLHTLRLTDYDYCREELVPELVALRDEGKIGFIALSESTATDPTHAMLSRAVQDDCWDVMMVGFNLFNQSARDVLFPDTIAKGIAVEVMASARSEFSRPDLLAEHLTRLVAAGELEADDIDPTNPLRFLTETDGVESLTDASYRLAAHEPGVNVVLVGTGNIDHLEANVRSLSAGPLPAEALKRLTSLFGHLSLAVQVPGRNLV